MGQAHPWDRPTLGTGPFLGQAHSWDRPTLGTGPLLGQALSWDRPILGTGALLGPLILLEHLAHLPLSNRDSLRGVLLLVAGQVACFVTSVALH